MALLLVLAVLLFVVAVWGGLALSPLLWLVVILAVACAAVATLHR